MLFGSILIHSLLLVLVTAGSGRGGEKRKSSSAERSPSSPPARRQRVNSPPSRSPSPSSHPTQPGDLPNKSPSADRGLRKESSSDKSPSRHSGSESKTSDYRKGGFTTSGSLSSWQSNEDVEGLDDKTWTRAEVKGPHVRRTRTTANGSRRYTATSSDAMLQAPMAEDYQKSQTAVRALSQKGYTFVNGAGGIHGAVTVDARKSKKGGAAGIISKDGAKMVVLKVPPGSKQKFVRPANQLDDGEIYGELRGKGLVKTTTAQYGSSAYNARKFVEADGPPYWVVKSSPGHESSSSNSGPESPSRSSDADSY